MFDNRSFKGKIWMFESDYQELNMFKSGGCMKKGVQIHSMFEKMMFEKMIFKLNTN